MVKVEIKYPPGPSSKVPGKILRQFLRDPLKPLLILQGNMVIFRISN